MTQSMRPPTLETLGLGSVLDIFRNGRLPTDTGQLVDRVFGESGRRGSLVVSGANGIVGAGKTMQLGSRLAPYGVQVVGLDFPGAPDGIGKQYPGLVRAFGKEGADRIMANVVRLTYDGKTLPAELKGLRPRFLLEAIPEILEIKRAHYRMFRESFPEIEIRSVTSGFPSSELGVGIAHPAFPHEINKVWEIVEPEPSAVTQLFWALGLIPVPVSDHWSFVLDVLFCGLTLAGLRYHRASNMPFWKVDKFVRKLLGPNPFRAHDAIGAKGANFLTWSCLHHLAERYGELFRPTRELEERKETGQTWYPPNHFRPLVDWRLDGRRRRRAQDLDPGSALPDGEPHAAREAKPSVPPQHHRRALRAVPARHPRGDARARTRRRDRHGGGLPPTSPGGRRQLLVPRGPRAHGGARVAAALRQRRARRPGRRGHDRPRELQRRRRPGAEPRPGLATARGHPEGSRDRRLPSRHPVGGRRHR